MRVSPSQVNKWRRCQRAYAFEYVEGLFPPSSDRQMFGTSVHTYLERYLRTGEHPEMAISEGAIAASGLQWLPAPGPELLVEKDIRFPWTSDIEVTGIIDCAAPPGYACSEPLIIDHKTTSDLKWAKTPELLATDEQAILYAVWAMLRWNTTRARARWVYYAATNPRSGNRKPRGSRPVEVVFDTHDPTFGPRLSKLAEDIGEMVTVKTFEKKGLEMPPSPQSCKLFGGCFHQERCSLTPDDALAAYMGQREIR